MKVIKRDGAIKDFELDRIRSAIYKAYMEVYHNEEQFKEKIGEIITEVNRRVLEKEEQKINIEEIQDIVIEEVNKVDKVVGKAFKDYREERNRVRESKSEFIQGIIGLLDNTNFDVLTENSNKQSQLASTQRDLIAGEVSKYISTTKLIPKHLVDAHNVGIIKIHDMDYFLQGITNCELVNLEDMLQNGTVINKKMIEKPKSLKTAMTLATQISAQIASSTYGGQTMSLSHLAPFVRISKEKIISKYNNYDIKPEVKEQLIKDELNAEIRDSVQTFNYQISTLMTTNGQSPFISLCMYISENPEYEEETIMLIEEFLKQRYEGMKNQYGVISTPTFPKMLYFLDENNTYKGSKYYWLTELAVKCVSKRMNPDFISAKKMKELTGYVFPCMGCRSFLSPWFDKEGKVKFYGRGNLGVCTINLPHVALSSEGDMGRFWKLLDERLELCKEVGILRYEKLKGVKASVAPIMWCHGAIARLNPDDDILDVVGNGYFTVSLGYTGLYETTKYMIGESHTSKKGFEFAEKVMKHLRDKCEEWKEETGLGFGVYGTPQESSTEWFSKRLKQQFGEVEDITDKGWITNSYHVDIREPITAFDKIEFESKLQKYSTGGAVSYVEVNNMEKNPEALMQLVQFMYEHIMYAEINFESDVCGECHYSGVMDNDPETLDWVCPNCGNRNQDTLSVVRRCCGYLSETYWITGRKLDILNRVKHL